MPNLNQRKPLSPTDKLKVAYFNLCQGWPINEIASFQGVSMNQVLQAITQAQEVYNIQPQQGRTSQQQLQELDDESQHATQLFRQQQAALG